MLSCCNGIAEVDEILFKFPSKEESRQIGYSPEFFHSYYISFYSPDWKMADKIPVVPAGVASHRKHCAVSLL